MKTLVLTLFLLLTGCTTYTPPSEVGRYQFVITRGGIMKVDSVEGNLEIFNGRDWIDIEDIPIVPMPTTPDTLPEINKFSL